MENKSLITKPEVMPTFKSKELNIATKNLYKVAENVYQTAFDGNKQICIILARVEKNKAYKEDGFKSLAEYCESIGFDKSKVHKMENAGRLYDSENETVKEFAASMGYGNLAILASAPEDEVAKAIENGELDSESTQSEISTWKADFNAKNAKEKVLSEMIYTVFDGLTREIHRYKDVELRKFEDYSNIEDYIKLGTVSDIAVYKGEEMDTDLDGNFLDASRKWDVYQCKYDFRVFYVNKVKPPKASKKPKVKSVKKMTREELLAALAALEASEE